MSEINIQETDHKDVAKVRYTRSQWLLLITCILAHFGCASCWSLQGPFYPAEADRRHIQPSVYGMVFSVYSLTEFVIAPLYGKYVAVLDPRFLAVAGSFLVASCCILFGFLSMVAEEYPFVILSFAIRIVEAAGDAACITGSTTLIVNQFSDHVGSAFATLRMFYSVGLITGPVIGGVLFQVGGFILPFIVMGSFLICFCIVMYCIFYHQYDGSCSAPRPPVSVFKMLRIPSVLLCCFSVSAASISIGFLISNMGLHFKQFSLTPLENGLMFVISGIGVFLSATHWGWLSDGKVHPKLLTTMGALLMVVVYFLIGPAPFLSVNPHLWLCIVALAIHGITIGAETIVPFSDAVRECVKEGFPNDMETFGAVSGLYTSSFQIGTFIGPSIGGVLVEAVGFRSAGMFVLSTHFLLAILACAFYCHDRFNKIATSNPEVTPILGECIE